MWTMSFSLITVNSVVFSALFNEISVARGHDAWLLASDSDVDAAAATEASPDAVTGPSLIQCIAWT